MDQPLPDWQLPPGVTRGLWSSLQDAEAARRYDEGLVGSRLLEVDVAFARRHFARPGRLLDLGCGTGRLLLPFARQGFPVLGVDLSEEMLRVAGSKAAAAGLAIQRVKANLAAGLLRGWRLRLRRLPVQHARHRRRGGAIEGRH